jgi:hypothetical protein
VAGQPWQDSRVRTAVAGQPWQDSLGRTALAGQPWQDSLGRTALAGQPCQDSRGRTAVAGQPWQDSRCRTAVAEQPLHDRSTSRKTATEQPGQNIQDRKPKITMAAWPPLPLNLFSRYINKQISAMYRVSTVCRCGMYRVLNCLAWWDLYQH